MRKHLSLIFSLLVNNCSLYFLEPSNPKPQWLGIYWAPTNKNTEAKLMATSAMLAYSQVETSDYTDKALESNASAMSHTHTHKHGVHKSHWASEGSLGRNRLLVFSVSTLCWQSPCGPSEPSAGMTRLTATEWHLLKLFPWHQPRGKRKLFNDGEPPPLKKIKWPKTSFLAKRASYKAIKGW